MYICPRKIGSRQKPGFTHAAYSETTVEDTCVTCESSFPCAIHDPKHETWVYKYNKIVQLKEFKYYKKKEIKYFKKEYIKINY